MSGGRLRTTLIVATAAMILGAAAWWALPRLVAALPGRVLHYVPERLVALVTTPLPAALPAPAGATPDPAAVLTRAALAATPPPASPPATEAAAASSENAGAQLLPTPTLAPSPTPAPSLAPYGRIDGLPIIPQKFNNCGPTNLTLVLNHYGLKVDQFDVAGVVRPNYEDRNVSPAELVAYVRDQTDLEAAAFAGGDIDLLRRLIAAGFPVLIEKGLEADATTGWMGHYLTVYGYDDITQHLLVRDTYLGPWRGDGLASYADTERYWAQFNNAFIVVYAPERAGELAALLGPTFASDTAMWSAVAERARRLLAVSPTDAFAWFNLGASLTALAAGDGTQYESAAAAFDQARLIGLPPRMLWYQFAPYEAYLGAGRPADVLALAEATLASQGGRSVEETYLYRGHAYRALGDEAAARADYSRAAELNPSSPVGLAARAALDG